jgi:hypothetical protein
VNDSFLALDDMNESFTASAATPSAPPVRRHGQRLTPASRRPVTLGRTLSRRESG